MQSYNFNLKNDLVIIINDEIIEAINEVTLTRYMKDMPTEFDVEFLKSDSTNISLGNSIVVKYKDINVFKGFIFVIDETEDDTIKCKAYDQLRYLKNEHTMVVKNKTASDLIKELAGVFNLKLGNIVDTGIDIAPKQMLIENKSLFQIIYDALEYTTVSKQQKNNRIELYLLYDDFGSLTLNKLGDLSSDVIFDKDNIISYSFGTSIDTETYNRILVYSKVETDDKVEKNILEYYRADDSSTQTKWGVLQKVVNADHIKKEQAQKYVNDLLSRYNVENITFNITTIGGDVNIRGGSKVAIMLNTSKSIINKYLIVNKVTHKFASNEYTMELELIGVE